MSHNAEKPQNTFAAFQPSEMVLDILEILLHEYMQPLTMFKKLNKKRTIRYEAEEKLVTNRLLFL